MEIYNGNYCVYIHTNRVNAKRYVGITCQKPNRRWRNGDGYKNHRRFYNAIKKYGWDSFDHEIIASNLTEDEAKNFEIILIRELQTQNKLYGYNETAGGEGICGYHHTDDAKEKISQTWLGKKHSVESIQKISESKKGHACSEETRKKIGDKNRGKTVPEEVRKKISETLKKVKVGSNIISQYDINGHLIAEYDCVRDAVEQTGVSARSINRGCASSKPACGYFWTRREKG